jgi:hypothetical protein
MASTLWPISALIPTSKPFPNWPTRITHRINLGRLSDFLARIPFDITINSAYRSYLVNRAVKGAAPTSQHTNGLAADLNPIDPALGRRVPGGANRTLATWLYVHRAAFPELDQVIWYEAKRHTHVGICPPDATGCVRGAPRTQFLVALARGGDRTWTPNSTDLQAIPSLAPPISARPPDDKPDLALVLATTVLIGAVGFVSVLGARHQGWIDWPGKQR